MNIPNFLMYGHLCNISVENINSAMTQEWIFA